MAEITVSSGMRAVQVLTIAPVAQASVDAETLLAGSAMDLRPWSSLAFTFKVATQGVKWSIYGANVADFSDEVAIQALTNVAAGAIGTYVVAQAPYAFYRVKIASNVSGQVGTATLNGIAKG